MSLSSEAINKKLIRIFKETFPDAVGIDWPSATTNTVEGWDSFATMTLFTTAEQEMNVRLGLDKIAEIHSFDDLHNYIVKKLS